MLEEAPRENMQFSISTLKGLIDRRLQNLTENLPDSSLKAELEYVLLSPGKRLRPIMLLTSTQAVGGEAEEAIPLALSIEALHAATLVHDDVIDGDQDRRGFPTVHEKWSLSDAILVGDTLISLSIKLASDYGSKVVKTLAETGLTLAAGEHLETSTPLTAITEAQYFKKIRDKSASLFRASAELGAYVGGGSSDEVEALAEFGERFGLAYQIKDDLDDLAVKGDLIPTDLRNRIPTLPVIRLYQNGDSKTRTLLERSFGGKISLADAQQIVAELNKESILYCEQKILENVEAACSTLSALKSSEAKNRLLDMFKIIITTQNSEK